MEQPAISIIIPTYNRKDALKRCLDALRKQVLHNAKFEVLVIDDGSAEAIQPPVQEYAPIRITCIRQKQAGANAARNRGLSEARAPIVLFLNDDTIAEPDLLARHLALHDRFPEEEVAVLGRMTIHPDFAANPLSPLHHDASFAPLAGRQEVDWTAFFTCNLSVKAAFLARHGRFDETLRWHEDIELGQRLAPHGLRLLYAPEALGYHWHSLDETQFLRIAEREGTALALWWKKAPDLAPVLGALGMVGPEALPPAFRHRLGDAAFASFGDAAALRLAEQVSPLAPGLSRAIWRKVFQFRKRRAIRDELSRVAS
ncbi:glycosyl transferase [Haematobacter missouriensis]|uniref:Glycosyl transferase n=1 Tax=Haematobacter missouriensis TaxID=366616 RepID=A0A212AIJ1_9RHOB|nr:glycosyltransferase family 2 protein [Haematobacter missouriensis]KFI32724.1 glycosyl transferase [Haematobacter missouriensis]OWJ79143.1 glycosyl transferase [Haematobacter missouriensis]OWJ81287.1 glycosyl transferase [Haematobacter missouriensis]